MIARIRELLTRTPFRPFIIHTRDGRDYRIPTVDHANISPKGFQVNVWFDDSEDGGVTLAALHITGVELEGVVAA